MRKCQEKFSKYTKRNTVSKILSGQENNTKGSNISVYNWSVNTSLPSQTKYIHGERANFLRFGNKLDTIPVNLWKQGEITQRKLSRIRCF